MKTESLIRELSTELKPVKPVAPPWQRAAAWLAIASVYVAAGAGVTGIRRGKEADFASWSFIAQFALPLIVALVASASGFLLSVPDRRKPWPLIFSLCLLGATGGAFTLFVHRAHEAHIGVGQNCLRNILLLGLPPTLLFLLSLGRAAPLRPGPAGMLAAVGSSALACAATRFICPNEDPLHFLAWHFFPVVFFGLLGIAGGQILLRHRVDRVTNRSLI